MIACNEKKVVRQSKAGTRGLTIAAVAAELGLGVATVWRRIRDGDLPAVRCSGRTLILREDLEAFIANLPRWGKAA